MVKISTFNYPKLVELAKEEILYSEDNDSLSAMTKSRLNSFLDSYITFFQGNHHSGWDDNLSLTFEDFNPSELAAFRRISLICNIPQGEILNILMKIFIDLEEIPENFDFNAKFLQEYIKYAERFQIFHIKHLIVSKADLQELGGKASFVHIDHLEFAKDIPEQLFLDSVYSINHCKELVIPETFSKLTVLGKAKFCREIIFV